MTRQALLRHRADILRRGALVVSITAGAALWALTMLRASGVEVL
jgi:hypothetical protein